MSATEDIIDDDFESENDEPTWRGARDDDDLSEQEPEQWDIGDDADDRPLSAGDAPLNDDIVSDLMASGHGVQVLKVAGPEKRPPCRYCGGPLYPVEFWQCEITLELFVIWPDTPWSDIGCQCSWCVINRGGARPVQPGRPRVHCQKPKCKKAHKSAHNAKGYQRRVTTASTK